MESHHPQPNKKIVMRKFIFNIVLLIFISACKKTEMTMKQEPDVVSVSSNNPLNKNLEVLTNSVSVGSAIKIQAAGSISNSGGGGSVVERGFCYSNSSGPGIIDNKVLVGDGPGSFFANITGLTPGTTYYIRAYAIRNNNDVYYGNEVSFTTLNLGMPAPGVGIVYDIDGNPYQTITLGTQVWMVENLKTTRYRDGTPIPNITDNGAWASTNSGAYCNYNNDPSNAAVFGRLYNSYAVNTRMIAPSGWHVPTYYEWSALVRYLGGTDVAGGRMKEAGLSHWLSPNTAADNSSGFTTVGSGYRVYHNGTFAGLNTQCSMWTSTDIGDHIVLFNDSAGYSFYCSGGCNNEAKQYGFAIRCIKD
jgi:uncharacterized protein (TIGR02145 family)